MTHFLKWKLEKLIGYKCDFFNQLIHLLRSCAILAILTATNMSHVPFYCLTVTLKEHNVAIIEFQLNINNPAFDFINCERQKNENFPQAQFQQMFMLEISLS